MKDLRKGNKYRFSLQWTADTQEGIAAGEFLDRLGNKKSDIVVMAVWAYLQAHPEIGSTAEIKIKTQAIFSESQVQAEIKKLVDAYMDKHMKGVLESPQIEPQEQKTPLFNDDDLNDMLDNLNIFDT